MKRFFPFILIGIQSLALSAAKYNVLQTLNDLHNGDTVMLASSSHSMVIGAYASGNYIPQIAATKDAEAHTLTCTNAAALYTVVKDSNKLAFRDKNGNYLFNASTSSKSKLQAKSTLDKSCYWTATITNEIITLTNIGNTTRNLLLYNKSTSGFGCYAAKDDKTYFALTCYANNAPDFKQKERHPAITIHLGETLLSDTLNWGEVVYDDSWGTEVPPYSELKTLTITGTDLIDSIRFSLSSTTAFSTLKNALPAKGGSLSVNFEVENQGSYSAVLTISGDTIQRTIVLLAKAVKTPTPDPEKQPSLYVSADSIVIDCSLPDVSLEGIAWITFSAKNLSKPLYVKWLKNNTEPTSQQGDIQMMVDDQSIAAGETAQFAAPAVDTAELIVDVTANEAFSYTTQLQFYSYQADSKTEMVINQSLPLIVRIEDTPSSLHSLLPATTSSMVIKYYLNGQYYIQSGSTLFSPTGILIH